MDGNSISGRITMWRQALIAVFDKGSFRSPFYADLSRDGRLNAGSLQVIEFRRGAMGIR